MTDTETTTATSTTSVASGKSLALDAAREELCLRSREFALGIELGAIRTTWRGGERRIRAEEIARLRERPGELVERTRVVHAAEAAELAGVSKYRFGQLALAGFVRPVASYTNRYHAEVWLYSAAEARLLPKRHPQLLGKRMPEDVRTALGSGADRRAEGLRGRLRTQAVLALRDPWARAAAWFHWASPALPSARDDGQVPPTRAAARGPKAITPAELVHLARRTAEYRLGEVLGARTHAETAGEQADIAREFASALRKARRGKPAPELLAPTAAAALLGCTEDRIPGEYRGFGVPADLVERCVDEGRSTVPEPGRLGAEFKRQAVERRREERLAARQAEQAARQRHERQEREAAARARARIPARTAEPTVTLHLGPTNSGKTHDAITLLADRGAAGWRGVYAAPLRMLAFEVYERLRARLGADLVGLRTGEEHLNPDAPVLCCTAEAAPTEGEVLVVDEAHWLADRERGHAWTRLLLSGAHTEVHVIAAPETEPLLHHLLTPAASLTTVRHVRHTALTLGEPCRAATLPQASALVAFSRKAVLALHRELIEAGRKATVLYGALPPAARREQVRRLADGEIDVIVTTDVIGHGVNLPLRAVVFAETSKYDGSVRRELRTWEAAQIAGRAGRRDHGAGEGLVTAYQSRLPGLTVSARLLQRAVEAANGTKPGGLRMTTAPLRPAWSDLGHPAPGEILHALAGWTAAAHHAARSHPWLAPMPVDELHARLRAAGQSISVPHGVGGVWPQDGRTVWRLITLPIDADADRAAYPAICRAVLRGAALRPLLRPPLTVASMSLPDAEAYAALMRDLRTAALAFGGECGGLSAQEAAAGEHAAAARIIQLVAASRPLASHGTCDTCQEPCAPWFTYCDTCHTSRYAPHGGFDEEEW